MEEMRASSSPDHSPSLARRRVSPVSLGGWKTTQWTDEKALTFLEQLQPYYGIPGTRLVGTAPLTMAPRICG
jgi:hypothetical protein